MIVVGVTGKYCAGKSTVGEILEEHGYIQIEVDRLGHEALLAERDRVADEFGDRVLDEKGGVDRRALADVVFSDDAALRRLESILHPRMVEMTAARVRELRGDDEGGGGAGGPNRAGGDSRVGVVINAAILFRMRLHPLCDTVLYVTAPFFTIWRRARSRDGASLVQVVKRLRSQRDVAPQYSTPDADIHSVENDGDREKLRRQIARLLPLP
ncbi:MAG: dephospho-CoA kinase [Spirochaetota bacterium]